MYRKGKLSLSIFVLFLALVVIFPVSAFGNAAQPPSLVVLVNNPPDDLSIVLLSDDYEEEGRFRRSAWEGYYIFYDFAISDYGKYRFKVSTKGESFECTIGEYIHPYNDVVTLDISDHKLIPGTYPFRTALLVSIRLVLTIFLEGIIFWLFGYRQKMSYLLFLVINIVTQGVLNIWLNSNGSVINDYMIFNLIFGEFFVFMIEMIAFPIFIKENKKGRSLLYAFIANFISLWAGGFMITLLPVCF